MKAWRAIGWLIIGGLTAEEHLRRQRHVYCAACLASLAAVSVRKLCKKAS